MTISFTLPSEVNQDTLDLIVDRAVALDEKISFAEGNGATRQHHLMNLTACIANGNPLRLDDLLAADDLNFGHDIFGIDRHICRNTGKLQNLFSPRFSQRGTTK